MVTRRGEGVKMVKISIRIELTDEGFIIRDMTTTFPFSQSKLADIFLKVYDEIKNSENFKTELIGNA